MSEMEQILTLHPGPQWDAFNSTATEILYGGAAGGGKSHLIRVLHIASAISVPNLRTFIYRLTSDELRMNHLEGATSLPAMLDPWIQRGLVTFNQQQMTFKFWNGSIITLRHMADQRKAGQAQGPDMHLVSFDELTHFDEKTYNWVRGRLRAPPPIPEGVPWTFPRIVSGTNPGSTGHAWVKAAFIDMAQPYEIRKMPKEEGGRLRQYIPAKVSDNPSLGEDYEDTLSGLGSPELVAAMRDGNWDIAVGARFAHLWSNKVMIRPFKIPRTWKIIRSMDWGSHKPYSIGWWAISNGEQPVGSDDLPFFPRGTFVRIGELYGWGGKPDVGTMEEAATVARKVADYEKARGWRVQPGGADPAIFKKESNQKSVHDYFARRRCRFVKAPAGPGSRVTGWGIVDAMLSATKRESLEDPRMYAFENCHHFRRLMPIIASDRNDPEDVDTKAEDHLPDEVRYAVARRTTGARIMRR